MATINMHDAKTQLSDLVARAEAGEEIIIADQIRIQVVDIRPGRIRLGVDAPEWMSIQRNEMIEGDRNPGDDTAASRQPNSRTA